MSELKIALLSFRGKTKILHLSWFAFFITFMVWFNHAPLMSLIKQSFDLSQQQVKSLLIINVALTIPARILVGMLVDRLGPRLMFSVILFFAAILSFAFALSDSYQMLALTRLLLGFVGAGFVVGIRMIGEWFPARQVGIAEGIYGGWGNFGSAASAFILPMVALYFGGEDSWRYAIGSTGVIALIYSFIYYRLARNTPKGSTYFKPNKTGAMEVSTKADFILYMLMNIPMYLALALLSWKLGPDNLKLISGNSTFIIYATLIIVYAYQLFRSWQINHEVFTKAVPEIHRYAFKQVAVLDIAYLVAFGSELAVVSMLPLFFMETFDLSIVQAGMMASAFAFMNLMARPGGGWFSDRFGRKKSLALLLFGTSIGYFMMSQIGSTWSIAAAVAVTLFSSFFVQASEGAVFALVPLVKRRMTGQIAGMVGAYGNVGGVLFLTLYSFVDADVFFMAISASAFFSLLVIYFLSEPESQTAEVMPDGTIQMIDVS